MYGFIALIIVYGLSAIISQAFKKNLNGSKSKKSTSQFLTEYKEKFEDASKELSKKTEGTRRAGRAQNFLTGQKNSQTRQNFLTSQRNSTSRQKSQATQNFGRQNKDSKQAMSNPSLKTSNKPSQKMQSSQKTEDKLQLMQDCLVQIQKVFKNYDENKLNVSSIDIDFVKEFKQVQSHEIYHMDRNDLLTYVQKLERFKIKNPTLPDKLMISLDNFLRDIKYIQNDSKMEEETFPERVIRNNLTKHKSLVPIGNKIVLPLKQSIIWKEILDKPKSMR